MNVRARTLVYMLAHAQSLGSAKALQGHGLAAVYTSSSTSKLMLLNQQVLNKGMPSHCLAGPHTDTPKTPHAKHSKENSFDLLNRENNTASTS